MSNTETEFGATFRTETPVLIVDALLSEERMDADELATRTGVHRSTLYQYLPELEDLGLVDVEETGRNYYSLAASDVGQLLVELDDQLAEHRAGAIDEQREATDDFFA